ncbi:hypothetical protein [Sphingobium sp. B2]|uniref:hypothetical protein n=1 Tax=Sphingobium sp. B2 TaxID=2583228 RepID=UPI0011A09B07|nr:hypothetical protein [Sphingobium sp. B2]
MTGRPRKILSLKSQSPQDRDAHAITILARTIEEKQCARWTYNRTDMLAAPQAIYRRNDSLYCDAVVIERDGVSPVEYKLGSFRLAGMLAVKPIVTPADYWPHLDLTDSRYASIIAARGEE